MKTRDSILAYYSWAPRLISAHEAAGTSRGTERKGKRAVSRWRIVAIFKAKRQRSVKAYAHFFAGAFVAAFVWEKASKGNRSVTWKRTVKGVGQSATCQFSANPPECTQDAPCQNKPGRDRPKPASAHYLLGDTARITMDDITAKLAGLGFELPEWHLPPSEALVVEFEKRFSLDLPSDYRSFLARYGGFWSGDGAVCPFREPTPCGDSAFIETFYGFTAPNRSDNVISATELIDGYPDVITIGDNIMGAMFWLKCTGDDAGHVYMFDNEYRSAWTDEKFFQMFSNIAPEIRKYLEMRRHGKLPRKEKGYEHVYLLATSFSEFISGLAPGASDS